MSESFQPTGFRAIGATTFLAPIPAVLLSCRGTQPGFTRDNLTTVAWTGVVCTDPPMLSISLRPSRHAYAQIVQSGAFCVNLIDQPLCRAADFCGVKSGRDVDKFAALGLHALALPDFPAPALREAPVFLLCRVQSRTPLGSHDLFLCRIEEVCVRESLFAPDGSVKLAEAGLIAYAHGMYYPLRPRPEGFFGYSVARPEVLQKRLHGGNPPRGSSRARTKKKEGRP